MITTLVEYLGGLVSLLGRLWNRLLEKLDQTTLKWLAIIITLVMVLQVIWLTTWVLIWWTLYYT